MSHVDESIRERQEDMADKLRRAGYTVYPSGSSVPAFIQATLRWVSKCEVEGDYVVYRPFWEAAVAVVKELRKP